MPENVEVFITAQELCEYLGNSFLTDIKIGPKSKYHNGDQFNSLSLPLKLQRIWSKGKLLIFDFGKISITNNLAFGRWEMEELDGYLCMYFGDKKISFYDPRKFGRIDIFSNKEDLKNKLNKIGVDILQSLFKSNNSLEVAWYKAFNNKRLCNRQICQMLLDQSYFSGIGNYLKSEILYQAQICPSRTLSKLSGQDIQNLLEAAKDIVFKVYQTRGHSFKSYIHPSGSKGSFKPLIYKNQFDSFGNQIIKEEFKDKRSTYWVPQVQI